MNFLEFHSNLSLQKRYALAFLIFIIALALRLTLFQVELGFAFITFFPAMVLTFALCGIGPGISVAIMSAIVGAYLFVPPHYSFELVEGGEVAIATFLFSSYLIGYIVNQLHKNSETLYLSKKLLLDLLEDQTELICRFKLDGTMLYVNSAFCQMFGKSCENLIGQKLASIAYPDDVPMIDGKLKSLSSTNEVVTITNRVLDGSGNVRWIQFIIRAIFDEDSKIFELQAVGRDITEQKHAQDIKREEYNQLAQISASVPGMIYQYLKRPDGTSRFPYASEAIRDIYRLEPGDVKEDAAAVLAIIHPDDYDSVVESIQESAKTLQPWKYEYRVRYKDGTERWLYGSSVANRTDDGSTIWNGYITDVTNQKSNEQSLKKESEKNKAILHNASDGIHILDVEGNVIEASLSFCDMLGYKYEEVIGMNFSQWDENLSESERIRLLKELFKKPIRSQFERRHIRKDGTVFDVEINAAEIKLDGKSYLYASSRDISERKNQERILKKLTIEQQAMLDNELVGIMKVKNRQILWKNKAIDRIFGYDSDELVASSTRILFPDTLAFQALGDVAYPILNKNGVFRSQITMVRKNGQKIWIDLSGVLLSDNGTESMWMMTDITPIKLHEEEITKIAYHDILTDLPNRLMLEDRLKQSLAQAKRSKRMLAICYLDLDGFKPINDKYGHEAGDKVLIEIASRMQAALRVNDTVARIGGDEFVLLLAGMESAAEYKLTIARVADEIIKPIMLNEANQVKVGASIGFTIFPDDNNDADTLLRHADLAMYEAKHLGGNQVCIYNYDMSYVNVHELSD